MSYPLYSLLEGSAHFTSLPSKKAEKWQFSPLHSYLEREYRRPSTTKKNREFTAQDKYWVYIEDGQLVSHTLPPAVRIKEHPLAYEVDNNPFACLASESSASPLELCCHEDVKFSVYFHYSQGTFNSSSLNITLQEKVQAEVYFHYDGGEKSFITHASQLRLLSYSRLYLTQVQALCEDALFITQNTLHLEESAYCKSFSLLYGGEYLHNFIEADLKYKSEADISSLLVSMNTQKSLFSCDINHLSDQSKSALLSKQVIKDKSMCVFDANTKIIRETKAAQAKQASHALLLDEGAQIHSKPRLEIYSDDLSASHGSTVGELDQNAIAYLLSRGINEQKVRSMLISAFVDETLETIEQQSHKAAVMKILGDDYAN
jgi:Fe-S cluster assembly protein SufD